MSRNPDNSNDVFQRLAAMERRIAALERRRRDQTSVYIAESDTTIIGETRTDDQGNYALVTSVNETGLVYPLQTAALTSTTQPVGILSAFTTEFKVRIFNVAFEAIRFTFELDIPTSSTVEARIYNITDAAVIGNLLSINGDGTIRTFVASFSNPFTIGLGNQGINATRDSDGEIGLQVRYSSAAGGFPNLYDPSTAYLGSKLFITDTDDTDPIFELV